MGGSEHAFPPGRFRTQLGFFGCGLRYFCVIQSFSGLTGFVCCFFNAAMQVFYHHAQRTIEPPDFERTGCCECGQGGLLALGDLFRFAGDLPQGQADNAGNQPCKAKNDSKDAPANKQLKVIVMVISLGNQVGNTGAFRLYAVDIHPSADDNISAWYHACVCQFGLYASPRLVKAVSHKRSALFGGFNQLAYKIDSVAVFEINNVFAVLRLVGGHVYTGAVCFVGKQVPLVVGKETLIICVFFNQRVLLLGVRNSLEPVGKILRGNIHNTFQAVLIF